MPILICVQAALPLDFLKTPIQILSFEYVGLGSIVELDKKKMDSMN